MVKGKEPIRRSKRLAEASGDESGFESDILPSGQQGDGHENVQKRKRRRLLPSISEANDDEETNGMYLCFKNHLF